VATRLDRARVVDTALRVLNEVGLEGLTLRRIASELHVQAPALYWHFKNKEELLDEMATHMLRELAGATPRGADAPHWRARMEGMARGLRRMLLGYRDGAKVFSGTRLTDPSLCSFLEELLRGLVDSGLTLRDAVDGYAALYNYTVGFTIEEQAVYPMPGQHDARYDLARRAERIDGQRFPLALAAGEELFAGFEARFERGLALILRGLERSFPGG
jgi:TetR/AcrR family transcriptional regulator, tetracycline repressor protein